MDWQDEAGEAGGKAVVNGSEREQGSGQFKVVVKGHLSPGRLKWVDRLVVELRPDGTTHLTILDGDQATLYGLLSALRNLGVELVSVATPERASSGPDEATEG